ncbi:MAG: tRNA modification GTPase [Planctomycetes bacterium]|nr:tRNA modification GTPase [Planctomycetota bacterium]
MLERLDETIVAIATAPARGAVGIVRLSGPTTLKIAEGMIRLPHGAALSAQRGSTRHNGEVGVDESHWLPATVYLFRAPRSYTRQDLVEIHSIGSPAILEAIRRRALALGARPAEAGEFTARAFLHGAMSLDRAEGVATLIGAQTDTQLRASRRMMEGALSRRTAEARDTLAELLALVEADIDFAEEPIEFIAPSELKARLGAVNEQLHQLMAGAASAERLELLPRILLFGAPNAGKSSLMNQLSGTSRAICSAAAGTTRDVLSAPIRVGRAEAILLDTAGVDETVEEVITAARAMTLSTAERVDVVCWVVDATTADPAALHTVLESLAVARVVVAVNKCDRASAAEIDRAVGSVGAVGGAAVCRVSATRGEGVEVLRARLEEALTAHSTTVDAEALVLTERQRQAVVEAARTLSRAAELASAATRTVDCADLVAFELREALDALGAIGGEVTTEDLLGRVFARFCIGK